MKIFVPFLLFLQGSDAHGHESHQLKFNPNDEHDKAHLLEDLQKVIGDKDTSQMTADELQFYYFKQHDYDNNNKLDGIELIQGYFLR